MIQYHALLGKILQYGTDKSDRTGTGTRSIFGHQMRFDLAEGFPLLTTKKVHFKSVVHELLWMLSGSTNVRDLQKHGVTIWDEWADKNGDLGPVYGKQWRGWPNYKPIGSSDDPAIDQISGVIEELRRNPDSRRLVVSAWNVADLDYMALAPCHCLFQFNTRPMTLGQRMEAYEAAFGRPFPLDAVGRDNANVSLDGGGIPKRYLDCQLYQRSADVFLGVPFNIASYALLTHMMAQVVNMVPGEFIWTGGDVHLYQNHFEQAKLQLERTTYALPTLHLNPDIESLFDFTARDISIQGYDPHPAIAAPVAI